MYVCRHCGLQYVTDDAVMCVRCQAPKGAGSNFCPCCGAPVQQQMQQVQKVCMNCGVEMEKYGVKGAKSKIVAGLLAIFLGSYGVHNFYLGYIKKAVIQLALVLGALILYVGAAMGLAVTEMNYHNSEVMAVILVIVVLLFCAAIVGVRIWTFVEGIMILCGKIDRDGKGRILS